MTLLKICKLLEKLIDVVVTKFGRCKVSILPARDMVEQW